MIEDQIVNCPSCGEAVGLSVDTSAGDEQEYVEDCPVCCRPMDVFVRCRPGKLLAISISAA